MRKSSTGLIDLNMGHTTIQTNIDPAVLEVDRKLNDLVKRIELLNYVNPINIIQEKKNFFASKYSINPRFKYRKVDLSLIHI